VERPERCAQIVAMDTGLFTGRQRMTDAWLAFRDFVARTEDLRWGCSCAGPVTPTRATPSSPPTRRRSLSLRRRWVLAPSR
jgi:hypothetical protein